MGEMSTRTKSIENGIGQSVVLVYFALVSLGIISIVVGFLRGEINLVAFVVIITAILVFFYRPLLIFWLGPLLVSLGLLNFAENYYSLMLRFAPKFGFAYLQRAVVRQKRGDVENALVDYDKALAIAAQKAHLPKPPFWSVNYSTAFIHVSKADLYLVQDKPQQAITEMDAALKLNEGKQSQILYWEYRRAYVQVINASYEDALDNLNALYFDSEL